MDKSNCFSDLKDEETLYWLGFLAADGCVEERSSIPSSISITIKPEDYSHLEKFKSYLGSNNKIMRREKDFRICIGGRNSFIPRLLEYGITPRKTFTLKVIDELAKSNHFWRGVFDGDGTFGQYGRNQQACLATASVDFSNQFLSYLNSINIPSRTNKLKSGVFITGNFSLPFVKFLLDDLYLDSNIFLERKKIKYLNMYPNTPT